ncbi:hypothetical protein NC651_025601 [Populus alba x Populus x berolinensis]|nr:hypothetical protein NC651_025601 [Populus alba x Populus x berolinensis]
MEKASLKLLFVFVLVFSTTCFPEGAEALGYCSSDSDCPSRCPAGCTDAHCQYVAEGFPEGAEALGYCSSDSDCPSRCPEGCTDAHCQYVAEGDFECYCGLNPCLG